MGLNAEQRPVVSDFREELEAALADDPRFAGVTRDDRPDESTLATRFTAAANPHVWFEVAVRPYLPQVRVGLLTDDRWKSEDLETKIEESGDTMSEFVGLAFEEAGLPWPEPPVEHYREQMKFFYFATPLDLEAIADLARDDVRAKARRMLDGYFSAFGRFLAP